MHCLTKRNIVWISITSIVICSSFISVLVYFNICQNCTISNNPNPPIPEISYAWDEISFTLINNSLITVRDFQGKNLLIEFSSSDCLDCSNQIPIIRDFLDSFSYIDSLIVLSQRHVVNHLLTL